MHDRHGECVFENLFSECFKWYENDNNILLNEIPEQDGCYISRLGVVWKREHGETDCLYSDGWCREECPLAENAEDQAFLQIPQNFVQLIKINQDSFPGELFPAKWQEQQSCLDFKLQINFKYSCKIKVSLPRKLKNPGNLSPINAGIVNKGRHLINGGFEIDEIYCFGYGERDACVMGFGKSYHSLTEFAENIEHDTAEHPMESWDYDYSDAAIRFHGFGFPKLSLEVGEHCPICTIWYDYDNENAAAADQKSRLLFEKLSQAGFFISKAKGCFKADIKVLNANAQYLGSCSYCNEETVLSSDIYGDFAIWEGILEKYTGSAADIVIPDRVKEIGNNAFADCTGLTSVVIPDSVTEIDESVFYGCSGLTSVVIPKGVTKIDRFAFCGCSALTSIVIPDGVTEIGECAFDRCSGLTGVVIPDSVTVIGRSAFYGCSGLTSVVIPKGVTKIDRFAFWDCSALTSIVIPDSVTEIGECAFKDCSALTSVVIPDSVAEIGSGAFEGCSGLTSVTIPNSVERIKECAFESCDKVKSAVIPNSETVLDYEAFSKLTHVNQPGRRSSESSGGCYIATAVYGSYDCPEVWTLRRFRDSRLAETWHGRLFIRLYYALSPTAVRWFGKTAWFQNFWRRRLDPFVVRLQSEGVESTPYKDKDRSSF